jgi:aspartyl-tRNA(Asn)/glutamyl-tRNA(Gln) amidotransferase subunit A
MPEPMTLTETATLVRDVGRSATDFVEHAFARIDRVQTKLNVFLSLDRDRALAKARDIDRRRANGESLGPLAGVPIAVKDNLCTVSGATTCGSKILAPFRSRYNAHVIDRLEAADAVIVGKTNLDEFAMGSSTENSAWGPTRNPWNESRVAGGSSGGSAAAVAARLVPAALGSDTGGSIRLPAALCGVVGLKPSYGRVSRYGLVAYGSSLDQIGPITTTVADAALLLNVIAGHDPRDSTSVDQPVPDYVAALKRPLKGMRIGISPEYFGEGLDAEVRAAVQSAISVLEDEGAEVVEIHLPHMKYGIACYYLIATAEASSNLARFDGVHYGRRADRPADITDLYAASRGEGFGPEVKRRLMLGTYALSSGYYDAYYLKALKVRTLIKRDFEQAFARVDAVASPVAPTTAFRIGEKSADPLAMYLADIYTIAANLAGICAISLPCGFDRQGLPIGLQLMGPSFGEERLLALAHQYQSRTDHHLKAPPLVDAA